MNTNTLRKKRRQMKRQMNKQEIKQELQQREEVEVDDKMKKEKGDTIRQ